MALGTVSEGPTGPDTRTIRDEYPVTRGLTAGTTKHLVDEVDYDDEA